MNPTDAPAGPLIASPVDEPGPQPRLIAHYIGLFLAVLMVAVVTWRALALYHTVDAAPYVIFNGVRGEIDESNWMESTYFYNLFFVKHDVKNIDWLRLISFDQPPVFKYILGAAIHLTRHKVVESPAGIERWFQTTLGPIQLRPMIERWARAPSPEQEKWIRHLSDFVEPVVANAPTLFDKDDYHAGRVMVLFFGVLTAVLLAVMASAAFRNLFACVLAAAVFLGNGTVGGSIKMIYCDSVCALFSVTTVLALIAALNALRRTEAPPLRALAWSLGAGVSLGLALGTKFIDMYVAAAMALAYGASLASVGWRWREKSSRRRVMATLRSGAVALIGAVVAFVGLNPFLYADPVDGTLWMLRHRLITMAAQAAVQSPAFPSGARQRAWLVIRHGILFQPDAGPALQVLVAGLFLAGFFALARDAWRELARGAGAGPSTVMLCWAGAAFLLNGGLINMDWGRYYMPFILATALLVARGVDDLVSRFYLNREMRNF